MVKSCLRVGFLLVILLPGPEVRAESDWPIKADPPAQSADIRLDDKWAAPLPRRDGSAGRSMLRPATPSPFVLLGYDTGTRNCAVWNLVDGKKTGELSVDFGFTQRTSALSPDGKHLVVLHPPKIEVWNVESGRKVRTFGVAAYTLDYVAFRNNDEFIVRWDGVRRARVTVLSLGAKGPAEVNIDLPVDVDDNSLAISPGGKYLAALQANGNQMLFVDLDGRKVAKSLDLGKPASAFWYNAKAASFSPDGTELALLLESGPLELVLFDLATGKRFPGLRVESKDSGLSATAHHDRLQWVPDGSGWLIGGSSLVDRNTSQIVWRFIGHRGGYPQLIALDHLLVTAGKGESAVVQASRIPWKEIDRLLEAVKTGADALVGKGAPISVEIVVDQVRLADKEQVATAIRKSLVERLEALGLIVKDDAPCVCRVNYSESEGPELTIEKRSLFDPIPRPNPLAPPLPLPLPFGRPRDAEKATEGKRFGSGVVVSSDGHLLSCEHVVGRAKKVRAVVGGSSYEADVIAVDAERDLALLKVTGAGKSSERFKPLPIAVADKSEVGSEVRAFGFPLSNDKSASLSVNKGTVSGWAKRGKFEMLQIDAAVNPGNSGGPLLDEYGSVVGVNVAKIVGDAVDNVGFAAPAGLLRTFLEPHKITLVSADKQVRLEGPELVKRSADSICLIVADSKGIPDAPEIRPGDLPDDSSSKKDGPVKVRSTGYKGSIQLVNRTTDKGFWFWNYASDGRTMFLIGRPATEQGLRDNAFDGFLRNVRTISVPQYVSRDDPPVVFPGETNLGNVPAAVVENEAPAIPKKATKRGQE